MGHTALFEMLVALAEGEQQHAKLRLIRGEQCSSLFQHLSLGLR